MMNRIEKRGQVTIFIIVGIMIVVGILLLIFLTKDGVDAVTPTDLGPRDFIVSCVEDIVEDSLDRAMENGGEIVASQSIRYQGEEWNYLCYQADYYQGCYNLHPMLELQIEMQIDTDTRTDVQTCFNEMEKDFEGRGVDVDISGGKNYSIDLLPGFVRVTLDKDVEVLGEGGGLAFDDFGFEIQSPIYNLVRVAREIVNSESQFCYFEYNGYMLLYPEYDIRRIDYMDSKMYRVIDRWSGDEFKFAVRSCAYPAGIF